MRRKKSRLYAFLVSMFMMMSCFTSVAYSTENNSEDSNLANVTSSAESSVGVSYFNVIKDVVNSVNDIVIKPNDIYVEGKKVQVLEEKDSNNYGEKVLSLDGNTSFEFEINAPKTGGYHIEVDYFIPEKNMENLSLNVQINGENQFVESSNVVLNAVWKDTSQEYKQDDFGNDLYAAPERIFTWQSKVLNNSTYNLVTPLVFNLNEGKNIIKITNNQVKVLIGEVRIKGKQEYINKESYEKSISSNTNKNNEMIIIEGEKYSEKSESYIRGNKSTNQNANPYSPTQNKINELSESMWAKPGEAVTYKFNVKEDGIYYIGFKYRQSKKDDMPVFKNIRIDNEVLFDELQAYKFDYTKNKYENHVLNVNEEPVGIYLKKGEHTVTLESTADPYYETYENLLSIISKVNDIALQIKVITGNKVDKEREWDIDEYIPTLEQDLIDCAEIINNEYEKLSGIANKNDVALIANLKVASTRMMEFSEDLNFLVNNLDQFSEGGSSVAEYVSLILPELLLQPMAIERIYVTGDADSIPDPNVGFVKSVTEEVKKLALSFVNKYDGGESVDESVLNVWVNRPVTHIEVLRERVASQFEAETGIKVNISAMPDEQKLLLAVSAGRGPDVVLGASSYRPFDFALRGALYDLRQFEDFGDVMKSFNPEMFVPFVIGDECYAIPETSNFMVTFYRKDIMSQLNLEVPQTWDEVIEILPTLSRYGMNFNTPIANVGGMKHFGTTIPFIQQFDGEVYSEDGSKVEFGNANTVESFKLMTNLYTRYSLPENIPNFYNNFKKGVTPIGMADMNTYILLKESAPEIAGQWGIAPSVGVMGDNGELRNYQPSVISSSFILKDSNKINEGWEFIKWWMSDETQLGYANDLQLRYGPEYVWNTANLNALAKSTAFPTEDKEVILEQLDNTREIPRNPAYFAVERELSNAWNKVVFSGMSPRTALDQAIITSNREITKKLKEFGYMDENNNLIKQFEMPTREKIESWKE